MRDLTRREILAAGALAALPPGLFGAPTAAYRASRDPVRDLARVVRGPVLRPPDSSGLVYDQRWEGRRPKAVVQALDAADVQAVVRWAARTGTRLAVRSGGHSYGGWSTVQGGVVLDLRRLRRVARDGGTAWIGPGAQLVDVYRALARHGATVPAGSCPSVGLGGLMLGGGIGLAGRDLGLTLDSVRALRIVTPDGRLRTVDARRDPDLFWACRGGGGSFGVVTRAELELHPAPPASWFTCRFPAGGADAALAAWQAWAPHADPRMTSVLSLSGGGASAIGQWRGPAGAMARELGPLRRVPGAALSTGTSSYLALQRRWAGCSELSTAGCHTRGTAPGGVLPRSRFAAASGYVGDPLSAAGRAALLGVAAAGPGGLLLDACGGAINRPAKDATAFVHRDALFSVQALVYFSQAGEPAAQRWLRGARAALARHGNGEAYQNYADPDLARWRQAYYGENHARLKEIKARVDPDRLLAWPQAAGT